MNVFFADRKVIGNPNYLNFSYSQDNLINTMLIAMGAFSFMIEDKNFNYEKGFGYKRFKHALSLLDKQNIRINDLIIEFIDSNNENRKLSLLEMAIELKKYDSAKLLIKSGHIPTDISSSLMKIKIKDENRNNHDYSFQNFYVKQFYSMSSAADKKIFSEKLNASCDIKSLHFILKNYNKDNQFKIEKSTVEQIEFLLSGKVNKRNRNLIEEALLLCQKACLHIILKENNIKRDKIVRI